MSELIIEDGKSFCAFLNRIFLNGLIQEAVIRIDKKGIATCQAVDPSNAVCVSQEVQTGSKGPIAIGVGNLSTLCKFFSSGGEFTAALSSDKMIVKRKKHGQVTFQLTAPEEVPTDVKEMDMAKQIKGKSKIQLKALKMDDLLGYFNLLGCESVVFVSKGGKLSAQSPDSDTEKFKLPLGKCSGDFRVVTYAKHFQTVLKEVNQDDPVDIYMADDAAIVVNQGEQYWLIAPIEE